MVIFTSVVLNALSSLSISYVVDSRCEADIGVAGVVVTDGNAGGSLVSPGEPQATVRRSNRVNAAAPVTRLTFLLDRFSMADDLLKAIPKVYGLLI